MRPIVQPPPSLHCDLCHGELLLKELAPDGPVFEFDVEVFVCAKCGHPSTPMSPRVRALREPRDDRHVHDSEPFDAEHSP
jgi:hypothetical protein